ncbi:GGDEF domain-containing protein [Microvirga terricola]|uniref:diguanylate cyclase n=1 Tax=Microvirga terricola TaxID=2719797 RepID=A0ABX0VD36_9HYPH|nr:GGDEF domain-containing protein [Microvirga terricola]NIX77572.1 GGDEF domain-containing protein [Microvirga terricola]
MGGLLLFSWMQNRSVHALGWWGLSSLLGSVGVVFLGLQDFASREASHAALLGNALVTVGFGLLYCGCRSFNGRPTEILRGLVGLVAWLTAWPFLRDSFNARLVLMAMISGSYLGLSAWELLKYAPQRLISQRATILVFSSAAILCALRGLFGPFVETGLWIEVLARRWSAEMALLNMMYIPTSAVLLLSMAKERLEYESRQAALLDPLTLIPNRRAFFLDAEKLASRGGNAALSCLVFDLDNFKQINDMHGHPVGDAILQTFARVLAKELPVCAFGRLGGEEFAAFIQADEAEAERIAEEVRAAFVRDRQDEVQSRIRATVSVGHATAVGSSPQELLSEADAALYQAKARGRNRVAGSAEEGARVARRHRDPQFQA